MKCGWAWYLWSLSEFVQKEVELVDRIGKFYNHGRTSEQDVDAFLKNKNKYDNVAFCEAKLKSWNFVSKSFARTLIDFIVTQNV